MSQRTIQAEPTQYLYDSNIWLYKFMYAFFFGFVQNDDYAYFSRVKNLIANNTNTSISRVRQSNSLGDIAHELNIRAHSPLYSWAAGNKSGQWEAFSGEAFLFLEFFGSFCFKTKKDSNFLAIETLYSR